MRQLVAGGPQALSDLIRRQAVHANHFVPAGLARGYGNGRSRYFQKFGEEVDARTVRTTLSRRLRDGDLQRIANFPGDLVFSGARVDLY
jgi:hypothetical protein